MPAQIVVPCAELMLTTGVSTGFTVMVMAVLVAVVAVRQLALLVSTQVTTSLLLSVLLV